MAPSAPRSLTAIYARINPSVVEKGWQRVESWCSQRRQLKAVAPPHRWMPADLTGVCFNCFSPSHVATLRHQKTRCFRCHDLGHRSIRCPSKRDGGFREFLKQAGDKCDMSKAGTLVWRRKTVSVMMVAPQLHLLLTQWWRAVRPHNRVIIVGHTSGELWLKGTRSIPPPQRRRQELAMLRPPSPDSAQSLQVAVGD
jgi:hypothetical protein